MDRNAYHRERRRDHKENASPVHTRERERSAARARERREERRVLVINHYGGGCACCGESSVEFLTIDHIGGRETGDRRTGTATYSAIIRAGFPAEFQVLRYNCNCAKGVYGECPHQTSSPTDS